MDERSTVLIQLADVWGDDQDSLGYDRHVIDLALAHRPATSLTVLLPTEQRCQQQLSRLGPPVLRIEAHENFPLTSVEPAEIVLACVGSRPSRISAMDHTLVSAGYVRAGRAWGEAGETRRYLKGPGPLDRIRAALDEVRVRSGSTVVKIRDGWAHPDTVRARVQRACRALGIGVTRCDSLDDDFGATSPPPRVDVRDIVPQGFGIDRPVWSFQFDDPSPEVAAQSCFDELGVWPLSFGYPGDALTVHGSPRYLIAPIVPGIPYSFDDEGVYRAVYNNSYLGLTHRKAGWDCFRHVEILAAGAVPLMPDAKNVPPFAMVHYPKRSMARVVAQVSASGGPPAMDVRLAFRDWWETHLTSQSMARYILSRIGLDDDARVLFVDERIPTTVDYLSVLTLIGLKQVLGHTCHVLFPVNYIYADHHMDTSALYGRGFGYTGSLSPVARTEHEVDNAAAALPLADYDAIIVGSITRNSETARHLLAHTAPSRQVWIHGEDTPPSVREVRELRSAGTHLFIRSIHTGPIRSR